MPPGAKAWLSRVTPRCSRSRSARGIGQGTLYRHFSDQRSALCWKSTVVTSAELVDAAPVTAPQNTSPRGRAWRLWLDRLAVLRADQARTGRGHSTTAPTGNWRGEGYGTSNRRDHRASRRRQGGRSGTQRPSKAEKKCSCWLASSGASRTDSGWAVRNGAGPPALLDIVMEGLAATETARGLSTRAPTAALASLERRGPALQSYQ